MYRPALHLIPDACVFDLFCCFSYLWLKTIQYWGWILGSSVKWAEGCLYLSISIANATWEGKDLFQSIVPYWSQPLKELRAGIRGKNLEAGNEAQTREEWVSP